MAKKLEINAAVCDLRKVQEETLAAYESITIDAALALVNDRVRVLLARYPVTLSSISTLDLSDEVVFNIVNGETVLTGANAPDGKKFLYVNGRLKVAPDAGDALRQYIGIQVNGALYCPRSLLGRMGNLQVNGKTYAYPDGAVILKNTTVLDPLFLVRAKDALYWAAKRIIAVDPKLDSEALAARGARFFTGEAILAESHVPALAPLFDEDTNLVVVPDGASVVQDDLELTAASLHRYGPRLYVLGDLTLTEASRSLLDQIEYLHVAGDVVLPASLVESFTALKAEYGELVVAKGRCITGLPRFSVSRAMLQNEPDGLQLTGCAYIALAEDIEPQLILEKLSLSGCAHIQCSPGQQDAVYLVSQGCAHIGADSPAQPADPDLRVIDTMYYVM